MSPIVFSNGEGGVSSRTTSDGKIFRLSTPPISRRSLDVAHDAVNGQFVRGDEQAFEGFKATIEATFAE